MSTSLSSLDLRVTSQIQDSATDHVQLTPKTSVATATSSSEEQKKVVEDDSTEKSKAAPLERKTVIEGETWSEEFKQFKDVVSSAFLASTQYEGNQLKIGEGTGDLNEYPSIFSTPKSFESWQNYFPVFLRQEQYCLEMLELLVERNAHADFMFVFKHFNLLENIAIYAPIKTKEMIETAKKLLDRARSKPKTFEKCWQFLLMASLENMQKPYGRFNYMDCASNWPDEIRDAITSRKVVIEQAFSELALYLLQDYEFSPNFDWHKDINIPPFKVSNQNFGRRGTPLKVFLASMHFDKNNELWEVLCSKVNLNYKTIRGETALCSELMNIMQDNVPKALLALLSNGASPFICGALPQGIKPGYPMDVAKTRGCSKNIIRVLSDFGSGLLKKELRLKKDDDSKSVPTIDFTSCLASDNGKVLNTIDELANMLRSVESLNDVRIQRVCDSVLSCPEKESIFVTDVVQLFDEYSKRRSAERKETAETDTSKSAGSGTQAVGSADSATPPTALLLSGGSSSEERKVFKEKQASDKAESASVGAGVQQSKPGKLKISSN